MQFILAHKSSFPRLETNSNVITDVPHRSAHMPFLREVFRRKPPPFHSKLAKQKGHIMWPLSSGYSGNSVPLSCFTYRLPQLPNGHRIVRAVVIAGNGVEIRQPVPVLEILTHIESQQAGFLIIP